MVKLEVCVDGPDGLAAAIDGGADRIELCSALALGGLTPSPGLIAGAANAGIPVVAMIRPRAGDFDWSKAEVSQMEAEIGAVRAAGLAGVVLGAATPDGRLDEPTLERLAAAATGLDLVLHRVFDLVSDAGAALETAVKFGFDRILTSGGSVRAMDGLEVLASLHRQAAGRIAILPGSGLTPENVGELLDVVPVAEVHASCSEMVADSALAVAMGFAAPTRLVTSAGRVRAMKAALNGR